MGWGECVQEYFARHPNVPFDMEQFRTHYTDAWKICFPLSLMTAAMLPRPQQVPSGFGSECTVELKLAQNCVYLRNSRLLESCRTLEFAQWPSQFPSWIGLSRTTLRRQWLQSGTRSYCAMYLSELPSWRLLVGEFPAAGPSCALPQKYVQRWV